MNSSVECFPIKSSSSVLLVVIRLTYFFQSLGAPWLALSSSSWSCLLLGTASVRCPLHLLGRPSHRHVRLLSGSGSISRGDTRLFLREAGILQKSAAVGFAQYRPLPYRNSSVFRCWQGLPEHWAWEIPLHSDDSITELFLNDDS